MSSKHLSGRVAIVTGAARGIGRAVALRLAASGAHIVVADKNLDGAAEYGEELSASTVMEEVRQLGQESLGVQVDLCQRSAARELIGRALDAFGRIDILVNNAGGAMTPLGRSFASNTPDEDIELILNMNLLSAVYCSQEATPTLIRRGAGSIVNVASKAAFMPADRGGRLALYATAKMAVVEYTRFLAHELGPHGVRVNCVSPGMTATARVIKTAEERGMVTPSDTERIPLRRFANPAELASVVEFFAGDASSYVSGQCLSVCGGVVLSPT